MSYCSALNCTNASSSLNPYSFFKFPKDKNLSAAWVAKVKRKDFVPSKYSCLCNEHFEDYCFIRSPALLRSLGMEGLWTRLRLKKDAIPTLFNYSLSKGSITPVITSPALKRRQRLQKESSNKDKQKMTKDDQSARKIYLKKTRVKRHRKVADEEEIIGLSLSNLSDPSSFCKRLEPGNPANENDKNCRSSTEDSRLAANSSELFQFITSDLSNKEVQIYEDLENKNASCSINYPNSNVNPPFVSSLIINNSTVPDIKQDPHWKMDTSSILPVLKQEPTFDLYTSPDLSANEPSCELKITSVQSTIKQEPCDLDNALKLNNNAQVEFEIDISDLKVEVYDKKKLLSSAENFNRHFVPENIEGLSTNIINISSEQKSELLNIKHVETLDFNLSGNECIYNGINVSERVIKQEMTEMPSSLVEQIETAANSSYGLQVSLEENEISLPDILQKRTLKPTESMKAHIELLKKNTEICEVQKNGAKKRQKLLVKNKFSHVHCWEKKFQENNKRKLPGLTRTSFDTEKSEKVRKPQTEQQIIKFHYKKAKMTNLYKDNETGNPQTFIKITSTTFATKKARQQAILRALKHLPSDPQQLVEVIKHIIKTAKPQTKKLFEAQGIVCG